MKTVIYIAVSLDGFIARKDGDINWLKNFENNEIFSSFTKFLSKIDAVVIGRKTFEKVLSFKVWPYKKKVFVLGSTLKSLPEKLKEKAELISGKPAEILRYLEEKDYSNLYVDGGITIQNFLKEDLIDEMIITRIPILLGSGITLFGYLQNDIYFKHVETIIYSNGLVKSHYKRKRN